MYLNVLDFRAAAAHFDYNIATTYGVIVHIALVLASYKTSRQR